MGLVLILAVFIWPWVNGQKFVLNAPARDFRIPIFDEKGMRSWYVQGREGHYKSAEKIEVVGMTIRIFGSEDFKRQDSVIDSDHAFIFIRDKRAEGDSTIVVTGPGYSVIGNRWTWEGKSKRIRIYDDVKVHFKQGLGGALKIL